MSDKFSLASLAENPFVAGLLGGIVALRGVPGATFKERLFNSAGACLAAGYLSPAIAEYFGLVSPPMLSATSFVVGLFGLNMISAVADYIKEMKIGDFIPRGKR